VSTKPSTNKPKTLIKLNGENPKAFEYHIQKKQRLLADMEEKANKQASKYSISLRTANKQNSTQALQEFEQLDKAEINPQP
jgi:hypothetical protein